MSWSYSFRSLAGGLLVVCALVTACVTSPTGRSQLLLYSDAELDQMGAASFAQLKKETPVDTNATTNAYVDCVAQAIVSQLDPSMRTGWEVRVFASKEVNAFALPGKKIGVYQGLLGVARTPDELAAVIGHEVGHVLAHHGNERISQQTAAQFSEAVVGAVVQSSNMSSAAGQMVMAGFGLGAQYGVLLPYSRAQESEADTIGLDLMARAGFDPHAAITLWQDMTAAASGPAPPEWASTHPANESRIQNLEAHMPEAEQLAAAARAAGRRPACQPAPAR